jgi:hypothetical protein
MKKIACFLPLLALVPLAGMAHPGHGGTDGFTIIHYFVEPAHAVITYSILIGGFALMRVVRRRNQHNK